MTTDINYEPMTEEEALGLLPTGEYPATIMKAENKYGRKDPSKSYVVLTVNIRGIKIEKEIIVWCALAYILKHASDATGNSEKYQNKTLKLSDFVGKSCNVKVRVKEGDERYPNPKNEIWDFVKPQSQESLPFDDVVLF
jgi:hypothetical protein